MQPWGLLMLLVPLFITECGAERNPDIAGSTREKAEMHDPQTYIWAKQESTTNNTRENHSDTIKQVLRDGTISKNYREESSEKKSKAILRHIEPHYSSLMSPLMTFPPELIPQQKLPITSTYTPRGVLTNKPIFRPILVRPKSSNSSRSTPITNASSSKPMNLNKSFSEPTSNLKVQKQTSSVTTKPSFRITPTMVNHIKTVKPIMTPVLSSVLQGIMVKPKGKPEQRVTNYANIVKPHNHHNDTGTVKFPKSNSLKVIGKRPVAKGRAASRLSPAMLRSLTARSENTSYRQSSDQTGINSQKGTPPTTNKKIVKKHIKKSEADIVAAQSTRRPPPLVQETKKASPSVPLVIVSTQAPIIREVMHKKLIESRTFKSPGFMFRNARAFHHQPLHSMYGPPYDHYKFSPHGAAGGSFPPPPGPFYHSNKKSFMEKFVRTEVPRQQRRPVPQKQTNYTVEPEPYFKDDPIFLSPSPTPPPLPPPTTLPQPPRSYDFIPTGKKKFMPVTYNTDDPYFQPYDHLTPVPKVAKYKKPYSEVKKSTIKVKSAALTGKSLSSGDRNSYAVSRYTAVSDGIPGVDYPIYARIPYTTFACRDTRPPGIYGDADAGCQVWHICEPDGRQHSFLCPNGTIFNQQLLTCDWWYNVQCSTTEEFYLKGPSMEVYKTGLNHIPAAKTKKHPKAQRIRPKPLLPPLPKSLQKSDWSPYSNRTPTKRPVTTVNHHQGHHHHQHHHHLHHHQTPFLTPPPPLSKPSLLSPRGIKTLAPHIMEFQPYRGDSYPMFQIRKRHALGKKI